ILSRRKAHGVVVRTDGLDQYYARQIAASSPSGHLRENLKSPFRGAKIGHTQTDIGRDHAHQRYIRNVVPLGDHLRADQNVVVTSPEILQNRFVVALAGYGVAIEPSDPRLGQLAMQLLFHFFRALAEEVNMLALALRTSGRNLLGVVAVVAQ